MVELSLKDRILDSRDNIEIYLKGLKEMEKAFRIVGNGHVADNIHSIVNDIENEIKKIKFLADQSELNKMAKEFYFEKFSKLSIEELKNIESLKRKRVEMLRNEADALESQAKEYLYERNYRKHINTLAPLMDRETKLHEIINDPNTKKTARIKAERESDKLYEAIWGLMKCGDCVDPLK